MNPGALGLSLLLLLANAFFVAVEFGLMTARRSRLEAMADAGSGSAKVALAQSHEISLQLAGAQLGVTMASLGLGAVAEPAGGHLVGDGLRAIGLPEGSVGTLEQCLHARGAGQDRGAVGRVSDVAIVTHRRRCTRSPRWHRPYE